MNRKSQPPLIKTQLQLGANERSGQTAAGISNITTFTNSGHPL